MKYLKEKFSDLKDLSRSTQRFLNPKSLTKISGKSALEKQGKSPGSLIYTGHRSQEKVKIQVIDYTKTKVKEFEAEKIEDVFKFKNTKSTTWINITGVHDTNIIKQLGKHFDFHPLLLEDIVNLNQRPKMENFGDFEFLVMKMIYYNAPLQQIRIEQVSLILGKNFVISFQEEEGDVFNIIRQRIRDKRVKLLDSDYLCYSLVDLVVDGYFIILEHLGEQISTIEETLMQNPNTNILNIIYSLKREIIQIRKYILPMRELLNNFQRVDSSLVQKKTRRYIQDVYDHQVQVLDTIDTYRDMLLGLQDLYLSITSNKMNEVMKVLTVIATIFIPLTFIAGIYGMNFSNMPELDYKYGYPIVMGIMTIIGLFMIRYFKRKDWV